MDATTHRVLIRLEVEPAGECSIMGCGGHAFPWSVAGANGYVDVCPAHARLAIEAAIEAGDIEPPTDDEGGK